MIPELPRDSKTPALHHDKDPVCYRGSFLCFRAPGLGYEGLRSQTQNPKNDSKAEMLSGKKPTHAAQKNPWIESSLEV